MNTTQNSGGPSQVFELASHCTLREAGELKRSLLDCLQQEGDVQVNAAAVARVDTAGLQLLAAFARELGEASRNLVWSAASTEFSRAVHQLGLHGLLTVPGPDPRSAGSAM